jgi:hypothetical protein
LPAHCVLLFTSADKASMTRLLNFSALTVEFLRDIYRIVRGQVRPFNPGLVTVEELARTLPDATDTKVRVGLSLLEAAGLLRRYYDAPRQVGITLLRPPANPALAVFAQRAELGAGQLLSEGYLELCARTGMDATTLERDLLAWARAGDLRLNSSGRDALIALVLPPPADAEARINGLIDRFATVQAQQVSEIAAYARTTRCRHGYLSAYLGGQARRRCGACDNCGAGDLPAIESQRPDDSAQRVEVLRTLNEQTLGMVNLTKVLKGDATVDPRYQSIETFGVLNYRTPTALKHLIIAMVDEGLLERKYFGETAYAFRLTTEGARLLAAHQGMHA